MRTAYTDLNIRTTIDSVTFQALNIVFERFEHSMPRHSHGNNSYELHYIPFGHGLVFIDGKKYDISPNTLYMTGPHVEHEQIPVPEDPMAEYCIYFKLKKGSKQKPEEDSLSAKFEQTFFWFGQDTQELYPLMQQMFLELEHKHTGYMTQVEALLLQCIVKTVRNYESGQASKSHFLPSNLVDSKYLIVEESFLYDFRELTLESLSDKLGLGVRQTERFLKENYGKTFLQKRTEARMSVARLYLEDNKLTISDIADRLGYASSQHFSHAFRQYYGMSASSYRKSSAG